jgi:hypothetical protein
MNTLLTVVSRASLQYFRSRDRGRAGGAVPGRSAAIFSPLTPTGPHEHFPHGFVRSIIPKAFFISRSFSRQRASNIRAVLLHGKYRRDGEHVTYDHWFIYKIYPWPPPPGALY